MRLTKRPAKTDACHGSCCAGVVPRTCEELVTHINKLLMFAACLVTFGRAQSISNPGFESNSSYSNFSAPSSFGAWSVTSGSVGLPLNSLGSPRSGVQVLIPSFTSSAGSATVSQTISGLTVGKSYKVGFYTSAYSTSSYFGTTSVSVGIGGASTSFSYSFDGSSTVVFGSVAAPWVIRNVVFTAPSASATLTIAVTHSTSDPYVGFDDFSIAPNVVIVPAIAIAPYLSSDQLQITFTGILQESADLISWTAVSPQPTSPCYVAKPLNRMFWRAVAE